MFRLEGAVVVVTGASSGLGARFARVLSAAGANLVLAARRYDRIAALADELGDSVAVQCDVTRAADLDRVIDSALGTFGRVDVLVNNAGIADASAALDLSDDGFAEVVAVNLTATFALSCRAARAMARGDGGVILNVASILGMRGIGRVPTAAYAASKGGVISLTRELSAQWSRKAIRVNALAPGWFPSELTQPLLERDDTHRWLEARTPLARFGRSDELDGALLFLTSDASSFVTGQVLVVDGGWTSV